jgi:hypothetical protein
MKKQITRISPVQTAKVLAALSLIGSLPFLLFMIVPMMTMAEAERPPFPVGFLFLAPLFYGAVTFIFTLVGAWIYNLVTKYLGGIEFTSVEVSGVDEKRAGAAPTTRG